MNNKTFGLALTLTLFACEHDSPKDPLDVAAPRIGAQDKQGGLTVLDLKRQGCEERIAAAQRARGAVSVSIALAASRGAKEAEFEEIRQRLVAKLPEQPKSLSAAESAMEMSTTEAGIRALCASDDVYMLREPRVYQPY